MKPTKNLPKVFVKLKIYVYIENWANIKKTLSVKINFYNYVYKLSAFYLIGHVLQVISKAQLAVTAMKAAANLTCICQSIFRKKLVPFVKDHQIFLSRYIALAFYKIWTYEHL